MEQLVELLKQIQELSGAGIDALKKAGAGDKGPEGEGGPPEGEGGGKPPFRPGGGEGEPPPEGEGGGKPPFRRGQ